MPQGCKWGLLSILSYACFVTVAKQSNGHLTTDCCCKNFANCKTVVQVGCLWISKVKVNRPKYSASLSVCTKRGLHKYSIVQTKYCMADVEQALVINPVFNPFPHNVT